MVASAVLKCVLLAKFQMLNVEVPLTEYATATIDQVHNGVQFTGLVMEGRVNSVSIENPLLEARTMSYSSRDFEQKSLSTNLDVKDEHASIDCEVN